MQILQKSVLGGWANAKRVTWRISSDQLPLTDARLTHVCPFVHCHSRRRMLDASGAGSRRSKPRRRMSGSGRLDTSLIKPPACYQEPDMQSMTSREDLW